jgi:hypothetical protein
MEISTLSTVVIPLAGLVLGMSRGAAMGIEEAAYVVEKRDGAVEARQYAPQIVAKVVVGGTMEDAGN